RAGKRSPAEKSKMDAKTHLIKTDTLAQQEHERQELCQKRQETDGDQGAILERILSRERGIVGRLDRPGLARRKNVDLLFHPAFIAFPRSSGYCWPAC
ncbi:hypothetical protein, partial [Rhizobium sp. SSA_523]|uniref:hypothetical protein n=1 Tax=Rhizobium sp. SSA_523 TaxID=2952477 RepID=UPI0020902E06